MKKILIGLLISLVSFSVWADPKKNFESKLDDLLRGRTGPRGGKVTLANLNALIKKPGSYLPDSNQWIHDIIRAGRFQKGNILNTCLYVAKRLDEGSINGHFSTEFLEMIATDFVDRGVGLSPTLKEVLLELKAKKIDPETMANFHRVISERIVVRVGSIGVSGSDQHGITPGGTSVGGNPNITLNNTRYSENKLIDIIIFMDEEGIVSLDSFNRVVAENSHDSANTPHIAGILKWLQEKMSAEKFSQCKRDIQTMTSESANR